MCVVGPYTGVEDYVRWKLDDPNFNADSDHKPRGRIFYRPGYVPILWIPRRPRSAREHGTLAHEVFHAVCHLMNWAMIPLTESSEEVYCHAVGHGVTKILEAIKR